MTKASKEAKHEKRLRRRSVKKLSGLKESFKDDARRAVQEAAQQASNSIVTINESQASLDSLRSRPSLDFSHDSDCSHEKAIQRGSRLALREGNERFGHNSAPSFSISSLSLHELTTETDTRRTSISEERKKPVIKWKFHKRKEVKKVFLTSGITQEAWMCGVCAKSFASLEAAEKHEDYHIKEVVMDLGWVADNHNASSLSSFPTAAIAAAPETPRRPKIKAKAAVFHETPGSSLQPQPDVLRKSLQKMPTARVSFRTITPTIQREQGFGADSFPSLDLPTLGEEVPARIPKIQPPILKSKKERPRRISAIEEDDLLVPYGMREYVVLADEALLDVCNKAEPLILTQSEIEAEVELEWLAKDKAYYQLLARRALERQRDGAYSRFRTEGKTIVNKVQNKFVDAYQLMKEGQTKRNATPDHYNRKSKGDTEGQHLVDHSKNTLYVNVIVKNSIQVVSHELERLARQRWVENEQNNQIKYDETTGTERFRKFRAAAQGNLVKLAGLALASDFTPRRIAVQLSNDLYRLLTPRLKRRGVTIETEIEYRVGPYFVLAVNVLTIDWGRVVKMTNRDVAERKSKWLKSKHESGEEEESKEKEAGVVISFVQALCRLSRLTRNEVLAQLLAWLYYTHWIIYTPICWFLYHFAIGTCFRSYFLSSVADEIFFYVEEKGMEMEVDIREAYNQAAFMLSALRELRADGRELKKKQNESETDGRGSLLGPLLGPAIKEDEGPAPPMPDGFEAPENLEFIGLELDLPVGFRRLRWAFLNSKATFITEAVFKAAAKYENLVIGTWSKFDDSIGLTKLPEGVNEKDFIGLEKEMNYLMPKSAFVKANTCYETSYIEAYDDYCFCIKKKALSPEVPYGTTFVAWTKFVIINTGGDTCKMTCSVEAEFPNGPPMISRQIKSGMRAGVGELFVKIGETITKYADEFP